MSHAGAEPEQIGRSQWQGKRWRHLEFSKKMKKVHPRSIVVATTSTTYSRAATALLGLPHLHGLAPTPRPT